MTPIRRYGGFEGRDVRYTPHREGAAFRAQVLLDGQPFCTLENAGTGGPTRFYMSGHDQSRLLAVIATLEDVHTEADFADLLADQAENDQHSRTSHVCRSDKDDVVLIGLDTERRALHGYYTTAGEYVTETWIPGQGWVDVNVFRDTD